MAWQLNTVRRGNVVAMLIPPAEPPMAGKAPAMDLAISRADPHRPAPFEDLVGLSTAGLCFEL